MKRILSISYDEPLLQTRQMMLRLKGYEVQSALGFTAALRECKSGDFDLAIIGHSIPREDKEAIIKQLRAICSAPVLALRRIDESPTLAADCNMEFGDPEIFLNFVDEMLNNKSQSAS